MPAVIDLSILKQKPIWGFEKVGASGLVDIMPAGFYNRIVAGHVAGFYKIGRSALRSAVSHLAFVIGCGKNDNRNVLIAGMRFQIAQGFPAIHLGHVQVKNNQRRQRPGGMLDIRDRFLAVGYIHDIGVQPAGYKRLIQQKAIIAIVICI